MSLMTCLDLHFKDDLALLSHRTQNMRDQIQTLEDQGMQMGPKINATKLMRIVTRVAD